MGHFVINLPNNSIAHIQFGTVRKMQFLSLRNILTGKWFRAEKLNAYVVIIDQNKKCTLFKTIEGKWINENINEEQYAFWQEKIDEFENQNAPSR